VIERLRGPVVARFPGSATIDVGGLGLEVQLTARAQGALPSSGEAVVLTRQIVREDDVTLFGFADEAERDGFDRLLTVAGVGPRLALATVSVVAPESLRQALAAGDTAPLVAVPGVGKKLAQRMVLDLKEWAQATLPTADGAEAEDGPVRAVPVAAEDGEAGTAIAALVGLGYGAAEVRLTVTGLRAQGVERAEELVREGLRRLGRAAARTLEERSEGASP
jgi:holliday junction DNA helicase RuvA